VNEISSRKPGTKARISFIRNGKKDETTITVADRSKLFGQEGEEDEVASSNGPTESKLGIIVRPLTRDVADRRNIPPGQGVVVSEIKPRSFAEDAGLQRGDVILEINRQAVNSEEDVRRVQSKLKSGDDVAFLVRQRGSDTGTIFLGGTLP
jgi:serine protease Do